MLQRMVFYNYIALKEVIVNSENTIAFIHQSVFRLFYLLSIGGKENLRLAANQRQL